MPKTAWNKLVDKVYKDNKSASFHLEDALKLASKKYKKGGKIDESTMPAVPSMEMPVASSMEAPVASSVQMPVASSVEMSTTSSPKTGGDYKKDMSKRTSKKDTKKGGKSQKSKKDGN